MLLAVEYEDVETLNDFLAVNTRETQQRINNATASTLPNIPGVMKGTHRLGYIST